jgi:hypothetical protein
MGDSRKSKIVDQEAFAAALPLCLKYRSSVLMLQNSAFVSCEFI